MTATRFLATLAVLQTMMAAPAVADGGVQKLMTAADKTRLGKYAETRKSALEEARAGDAVEFAALDALLRKPLLSTPDFDLGGEWRCRTIKMGGISPLVVYDWFKCRVSDDGAGWMLEKTSGSQRTTGRFYDDSQQRMIYLGSFYVAQDQPSSYASGPDRDQVGYAFRTGEAEWRIEFPEPYYESKFDILEFKR
jgi:hypothetical protein